MSIVTTVGRAALAELVIACPTHLALGLGGDSWANETPALDYETRALVNEIGRKSAFRKFYVLPDDGGNIVLPDKKKYRTSETPTRHIYYQFMFDYGDGVGGAIREIGLFLNTQVKDGLPASQTWFTREQLKEPGTLLILEYPDDPDTFNPQKKGMYESVLTL